jgi:hypothetical protein
MARSGYSKSRPMSDWLLNSFDNWIFRSSQKLQSKNALPGFSGSAF